MNKNKKNGHGTGGAGTKRTKHNNHSFASCCLRPLRQCGCGVLASAQGLQSAYCSTCGSARPPARCSSVNLPVRSQPAPSAQNGEIRARRFFMILWSGPRVAVKGRGWPGGGARQGRRRRRGGAVGSGWRVARAALCSGVAAQWRRMRHSLVALVAIVGVCDGSAVAAQWQGSGSAVASQWQRSGIAVAA